MGITIMNEMPLVYLYRHSFNGNPLYWQTTTSKELAESEREKGAEVFKYHLLKTDAAASSPDEKRGKIEALIEEAMEDATVDYPAGREVGPRIEWDEQGLLDRIMAVVAPHAPPAPAADAVRDALTPGLRFALKIVETFEGGEHEARGRAASEIADELRAVIQEQTPAAPPTPEADVAGEDGTSIAACSAELSWCRARLRDANQTKDQLYLNLQAAKAERDALQAKLVEAGEANILRGRLEEMTARYHSECVARASAESSLSKMRSGLESWQRQATANLDRAVAAEAELGALKIELREERNALTEALREAEAAPQDADELVRQAARLLDERDEARRLRDAAHEAGNRYLQQARDARAALKLAARVERDRLYKLADDGLRAAERDRDDHDYNSHLGGLVWLKSHDAMLPDDRAAKGDA